MGGPFDPPPPSLDVRGLNYVKVLRQKYQMLQLCDATVISVTVSILTFVVDILLLWVFFSPILFNYWEKIKIKRLYK